MGEGRYSPMAPRCISLRMTRREWYIVHQALATIDCEKLDGIDPTPRELEWLKKKIESKLDGEKVPRKSERSE